MYIDQHNNVNKINHANPSFIKVLNTKIIIIKINQMEEENVGRHSPLTTKKLFKKNWLNTKRKKRNFQSGWTSSSWSVKENTFFLCVIWEGCFSWYGLGVLSKACCVKHSQALFSIRSYSSFQGWPLVVRIDYAEQFVLRWAPISFKARMEYAKLKPTKHMVERVKDTFLQVKKKKRKSRDGQPATICVLAAALSQSLRQALGLARLLKS